jgi:CheY-like chemotaxis protein
LLRVEKKWFKVSKASVKENKMRVMMAGEGVLTLQAMQRYLRLLGHQVTIVDESRLLQSVETEEPPDLIVMEYNLTWPGSAAILDHWLADPDFCSVPVVFFSRKRSILEGRAVPRIIARVTRPLQPLMLAGLVRFLDNMEWVEHQLTNSERKSQSTLLCH